MLIENLFRGIEYYVINRGVDVEYKGMEYDSRKVSEGTIFVALEGAKSDGHDFISQAIIKGAKMVIVSRDVTITDMFVTIVKVEDLRKKLGIIASNFYGWPQKELKIVGITGTKGKTTTTFLMETILGEDRTARIGTIEYKIGDVVIEANNTTPESLDLVKLCKMAVMKNMEYLVMEVSSHALELGRVDMLLFDVAVFNNLTQDHLDYHLTMENYFAAKLNIFTKLLDKTKGVINIDDSWITKVANNYEGFITYSQEGKGIVNGRIVEQNNSHMVAEIEYKSNKYQFDVPLAGKFNLYNIMAAFGAAIKLGFEPEVIIERLKKVRKVPGRFELVDRGQDFMVVVDYAHTDASLENILQALTGLNKGNIITIFGAGGDRDKTKRPKMAKAAAKYSNYVIITSDNPRTEDPGSIIKNVEEGLIEINFPKEKYSIVENRENAIREGIYKAKTNDIVLIAGKGHEDYQIIGTTKHHFDDREVAGKFLVERGKN